MLRKGGRQGRQLLAILSHCLPVPLMRSEQSGMPGGDLDPKLLQNYKSPGGRPSLPFILALRNLGRHGDEGEWICSPLPVGLGQIMPFERD